MQDGMMQGGGGPDFEDVIRDHLSHFMQDNNNLSNTGQKEYGGISDIVKTLLNPYQTSPGLDADLNFHINQVLS